MKTSCILLLAALLGGCATNYGSLPKLAAVPSGTYLLGPGDSLQVTVFGEADLSGPVRVNDSGAVSMPLIGPVQAAGLTVPETAAVLRVRGWLPCRSWVRNEDIWFSGPRRHRCYSRWDFYNVRRPR